MRSKIFEIPILGVKVRVYGGDNPEWAEDGAIGMVWLESDKVCIWLSDLTDNSLLVHECVHLAQAAMELVGVEDAPEWHASLVGYLFDEVKKRLPQSPDPSLN